jgi:MFS transporter, AAHS family, 4-hydroxybenzoate transporter
LRIGKIYYAIGHFGITVPKYVYKHRFNCKPEVAKRQKCAETGRKEMDGSRSVNVQAFLNGRRFTGFQWVIFALCFVIVLLDGFDTAAIGFIAPSLIKEWGVNKPELGPVLSAALFGLAAGAIIAGPLADRLGRKLILAVSVAVFGAACLASSYAANLNQRLALGLARQCLMPSLL